VDEQLQALIAAGAQVVGPERTDDAPGWRCDIVFADGHRVRGTGRTGPEAAASAAIKAEELADAERRA
jgi:hypothetical protein